MSNTDYHPVGDSPTDVGQSKEELEASIDSFGDGASLKNPFQDPGAHEKDGVLSDRQSESGPGGFIDISDDPHQRTNADRESEPVSREAAENLQKSRVDQQDEIVAEPDPLTGQEIAVLKKKTFFQKEGEASQL